MTETELMGRVHEAGLSRVADDLERLIKPSIRITTQAIDEDALPLGASKFGGLPDLPPGVEWPHRQGNPAPEYPEESGGPLLFLAQIRMDELPSCGASALLPPSGLLYFFAAVWVDAIGEGHKDEREHQKVIYYDGDLALLRRTPVPPVPEALLTADYEPEGHRYPACAVAFHPDVTLPPLDWDDGRFAALMTEEEQDDYHEKLGDIVSGAEREVVHRLLGYPQQVQGDMRGKARRFATPTEFAKRSMTPEAWREWEAYKQRRDAQDWELLLQVDTDPDNGLEWQGWGTGYFWIAAEALRARDFGNVPLIHQTT